MGAVNYNTSDYITMGIKPYNYSDLQDSNLIAEHRELNPDDYRSDDEIIYDYICSWYDDDMENIETELSNYYFWYYHITIKPGYYEGFTIDIENNFPVYLDSWTDRKEAHREITQIRKLLRNCAGMGMVSCFPGWCTGYENYTETLKSIDAAVREMRDELNAIPTYRQYDGKIRSF